MTLAMWSGPLSGGQRQPRSILGRSLRHGRSGGDVRRPGAKLNTGAAHAHAGGALAAGHGYRLDDDRDQFAKGAPASINVGDRLVGRYREKEVVGS